MSGTEEQMWEAAGNGDVERLRAALAGGADVNARSGYWTALMLASAGGHAGAVEALLGAGAAVDLQQGGHGDTALHKAASCARLGHDRSDEAYARYDACVAALLAAGADPHLESSGLTPLAQAIERGTAGMVERLLAAGAEATEDCMIQALGDDVRDRPAKIRLLLDHGVDPHAGDAIAVVGFDWPEDEAVAVARLLLDRGADVNHQTDSGWTALMHAVRMHHVELVRLLVNRGADPGIKIESDPTDSDIARGTTPLKLAKAYGAEEIVAILKAGPQPEEPAFDDSDPPGFGSVTSAFLVAGRHVDAPLTLGQAKRLAATARDLGKRHGLPLIAVPTGDLSDTGSARDDADRADAGMVVGLLVAEVGADEGGPAPVAIARMRDALAAAEDVPPSVWSALAAIVEGDARVALERQPPALLLTSCGPLSAAFLWIGDLGAEDDADGYGVAYRAGQDMSQEPHETGVCGAEVAEVSAEGTAVRAIDVSDHAHAARLGEVDMLDDASYWLGAQYD